MLRLPRLIPRLDIKGANVVKGIRFEGLRVVGNPADLAERYANDADELLYVDTVASLYGRNQLADLLLAATARVFIPITVEGGISSVSEAQRLLNAGADKIALNTAAIKRPALIRECADHFGSQAVSVSISARKTSEGWEPLTEGGRERSGLCARSWAYEAQRLGAGEILLTSVDKDGTKKGFDTDLLNAIEKDVDVPLVICGGMGSLSHLQDVSRRVQGVSMASVLHYDELTIPEMRDALGQS